MRGSAPASSGPPGQYPTPVPQVQLTASDTPFRIEQMTRSPGPMVWEGLVPALGQPTHPSLPGADPVLALQVPYPRSPLSPRQAGMVSHSRCRLLAQSWTLTGSCLLQSHGCSPLHPDRWAIGPLEVSVRATLVPL